MILYIDNCRGYFKKIIELISEFSKVIVYKINIQKQMSFHLNSEQFETKLRKLFNLLLKRIKYLGINLPKEMKDLYTKNYKMLMK